ncbi:hypothetical protein L9F63_027383, partial [Diploptera punctata]
FLSTVVAEFRVRGKKARVARIEPRRCDSSVRALVAQLVRGRVSLSECDRFADRIPELAEVIYNKKNLLFKTQLVKGRAQLVRGRAQLVRGRGKSWRVSLIAQLVRGRVSLSECDGEVRVGEVRGTNPGAGRTQLVKGRVAQLVRGRVSLSESQLVRGRVAQLVRGLAQLVRGLVAQLVRGLVAQLVRGLGKISLSESQLVRGLGKSARGSLFESRAGCEVKNKKKKRGSLYRLDKQSCADITLYGIYCEKVDKQSCADVVLVTNSLVQTLHLYAVSIKSSTY